MKLTIVLFMINIATVVCKKTGHTNEGHMVLQMVHGIPSTEGKYPWMVYIEVGESQCGGSLLNRQWVLTAAHCFTRYNPSKILLGTLTNDGTDPFAVTRQMAEKCCHKDFDLNTLANDICLLKLSSPVNFGKTIQPVKLPAQNKITPDGTVCTVMGWGLNEHGKLLPGLQEADVYVIKKQDCKSWYAKDHVTIPDDHLCAGHVQGGPDTCGGDSGGPLVTYDENDEYFVLGITSFGPNECGIAKRPGVYTKVSSYTSWIKNKMEKPCFGAQWTTWTTTCTVTCGTGSEVKRRKCQDESGNDLSTNRCPGTFVKYGSCKLHDCEVYSWGSWSTECSVTCGTGVQTKTRKCLDQHNNEASETYLCYPGSDVEQNTCNESPCSTFSWSSWESRCSVTCGTGVQTRTRKCLDANGNEAFQTTTCGSEAATEHGTCQNAPCTSFSWSSWESKCSVTCGTGVQTRTRKCLDANGNEAFQTTICGPEAATEHGTCQNAPCTWYRWGPWITACSATCGSGIETKSRKCYDNGNNEVPSRKCRPGADFQRGRCYLSACKSLYYWGPWKTHCKVTCGEGPAFKLRQCLDGRGKIVSLSLCEGSGREKTTCSMPPCKSISLYTWGTWLESCSVTCGKGIAYKERKCLDENGQSVDTTKCTGSHSKRGICNESPCTTSTASTALSWGPWKSWSRCRVKTHAGGKCNGFMSTTRDCLYRQQDVDPNRCIQTFGGDYYQEVRCKPYGC